MSSDRLAAVLFAAAILTAGTVQAGALLSVDEALRLNFPGASFERESVFLTDSQLEAASASAGTPVKRALVVRYVVRDGDAVAGTAYLDAHTVRTLDETLFIVVRPDGTIGGIEVLSFNEPMDYLPREGWYAQFDGKELDEKLKLDQGIRAVTGATLTADATIAASRRVLAVHVAIENAGAAP